MSQLLATLPWHSHQSIVKFYLQQHYSTNGLMFVTKYNFYLMMVIHQLCMQEGVGGQVYFYQACRSIDCTYSSSYSLYVTLPMACCLILGMLVYFYLMIALNQQWRQEGILLPSFVHRSIFCSSNYFAVYHVWLI